MSWPAEHPGDQFSPTHDPYAKADIYYGDQTLQLRKDHRKFSAGLEDSVKPIFGEIKQQRRLSHDAIGAAPRTFLIPVQSTIETLLAQEDRNKNQQITIDDDGPKVLPLGTERSEGYNRVDIRGTYCLSNLLQELTIAQDYGLKEILLDEHRLNENPVDRLVRFVRDMFWHNLTRCIDGANIAMVAKDPKDWTDDPRPRVYVPKRAPEQYEYYTNIARKHPEIRLDVQWLSENITPEYVRDLNSAPGLLAIAMDKHTNQHGETELRGKPFIVPGGRFNELYGWDSYMASLGLLIHDQVDLCRSMVENFVFCIEHYGKILNANRSYYLGRSQPPFLTDMTLRVYDRIRHEPNALEFLRNGMLAAIKEYYTIWTAKPRFDEATGLSRYCPEGVGVPPETESTHFKHVLDPYATKHGMSFKDLVQAYNTGQVKEPELDVYFVHDRAIRESGHDTSYRLENICADLATVDLNSCLYKIECDVARTIRIFFGGQLVVPAGFHAAGMNVDSVETAASWDRRAERRRLAMDKYMWNEDDGMYYDYNLIKEEMSGYESVTTLWAMWAGVATPRQAAAMVIKALPKFEEPGGLVAGTEKSRGPVGIHRPNRQWDYPFGWAPHQILAWTGFERYGYVEEAQRLAYRWLYMCTRAFVEFNGVVVEKYDVTKPERPHEVAAEYGNQGANFKGVPREGFGWVNASIVLGLDILDTHQRRAIATLSSWEQFAEATQDLDVYSHDTADWPGSEHLSRVKTGLSHDGIPHGDVTHYGHGLAHLPHSHGGSATHTQKAERPAGQKMEEVLKKRQAAEKEA